MNESASHPVFRRRNFLILPRFQLLMMLVALILSLVQLGILIGMIDYFGNRLTEKILAAQISLDHPLARFLFGQQAQLKILGASVGLVLALINLTVFLVITHRIAGPIFRVTKTAAAWRRGEAVPMKIRKGDFFQEMAMELESFRQEKMEP